MRKQVSTISGKHFSGKMQLYEDKLVLNIAQFRKGIFHYIEISAEDMLKQEKSFIIFKKKEDLFEQLLENKNMEITDQDVLSFPISVRYKGKSFEIRVNVPLKSSKSNDEVEDKKRLFELIERISQQNQNLKSSLSTAYLPIKFKGDTTSKNYTMFQVDGKTVKMLGNDQCIIFNHNKTLPNSGVHFFQFKILESYKNSINFGICAQSIIQKINAHHDHLFMSYQLEYGSVQGNGGTQQVFSGMKQVNGQSIVRGEIDMNDKLLKWYLDGKLIHSARFWKQLEDVKVYPFISLFHEGDIIEIINM